MSAASALVIDNRMLLTLKSYQIIITAYEKEKSSAVLNFEFK